MRTVIDSMAEGVIDAPPEIVFREMLAMYAGDALWRSPSVTRKYRGGSPSGQVGAVYEMTIHAKPISFRMDLKLAKVVENKMLEFEQWGDLMGKEIWIFEPSGDKTALKGHWFARKKGIINVILCTILGYEIMEKGHKEYVNNMFVIFNDYLGKK